LEVTVHLVTHRRDASHRRSLRKKKDGGDEWDWYDTNREEINGEFLELLEASVLSRMFGKELEDFHRKKDPSILQQEHDEIGGVASKNKTGGSKRKRKGSGTTTTGKKQQKGLAAIGNKNGGDDEIDQKPDKDIYFSFGELIQLAYKKQPIRDDRSSRTILFQSNHPNDETKTNSETASSSAKTETAAESNSTQKTPTKEAGTFHDRKKLSHRLLVWVSKSDAAASASERGGDITTVASRPGEGMYRSEMIPISSLFRKPKELMDLSDDDDDDDDDV
jgi:hypothetical protein